MVTSTAGLSRVSVSVLLAALLCSSGCSEAGTTAPPAGSSSGGSSNASGQGGSPATPGLGGSSAGAAVGGNAGASYGGAAGEGEGATSGRGGAAGSGGLGSAGMAGEGGSGVADPVVPVERSGKYALEFGSTVFEVDPQVGGRVTRFALNGTNVIASQAVTMDATNWGSTFWPSPQRAWDGSNGWPPIASIDSQAYSAAIDGNTIVLTSPAPQGGGQARVSVVKRFRADRAAEVVEMEFVLKNEETSAKSWAPWQVTRVAGNGLTFFTTGAAPVYNKLNVTSSSGITWFKHPEGVPNPLPAWPESPKLIADAGEPWLAHVAGNIVFIKTFPSVTPAQFAPNEGEIEIYAVPGYVEIEPQGAYVSLAAGASLTWTVRWYLRPLPSGASATAGNAALLSFVRGIAEP